MIYFYVGIPIALAVIGGASFFLLLKKQTAKSADRTVSKQSPAAESKAPAEATEVSTEPSPTPEANQPIPLVIEDSSLPEGDKNRLLNAVWYRCENPYCNHTQFLDVHHIIAEADGGTNALDNLIVLCSLCHALADKNEIPLEVLKAWILQRTERFKTDLNWPYKQETQKKR